MQVKDKIPLIRRKAFQGSPHQKGFPGKGGLIVSVRAIFERKTHFGPVGHNLVVLDTHIERFYFCDP